MSIEVIKPGLLTTLQDAGRPGLAHLGIGRAGAFDGPALAIANALCGNPRGACALEITLAGPTLRFHAEAEIALTGAPIPFRIDGVEQPGWTPVRVPAEAKVEFGALRAGCRSYLAVRGGFGVEAVLGSRSVDVNAQIGPNRGRPLRANDLLPIRAMGGRRDARASSRWWVDPRPWFAADADLPLRLLCGPHLDALAQSARKSLFSDSFVVQQDSNRVGLRLAGPRLPLARTIDMVSEGCVPGLLQLPPSGQPIAFGPECPVSGGYPRLGTIAAVDLPHLAQQRPGNTLRFRPCPLDDALGALRERELELARLEAVICQRLSPPAP